MGSSETKETPLKVAMIPWLGHGHVTPLLELAKKLSLRNFDAYICSTPKYLNSINNRITKTFSHSIHLVDFHLPPSPEHADHIFLNLLKPLQPDLLIHDVLLSITAKSVASQLKIPVVAIHTCSAALPAYYYHFGQNPDAESPFSAIHLRDYEVSEIMKYVNKTLEEDQRDDDHQTVLINTSKEIEAKYMDYLSQQKKNYEVIPMGALVHDPNIKDENDDDEEKIIEWLSRKDEFSTVFVAFGSEPVLKKEEIEEIAYGLEQSNVNFIWVIGVEDISLPQGFLERIQERGKIVKKWAPQAKILKHSSIGGFVSHCGWNSVLESIDSGVPIVAMPIHLDQPVNAKVVAELGVGVQVMREESGRLEREEISRVIGDVVGGKTGDVLRRRVGEMRERIRSAQGEEVEGVVQKLKQLCGKKN